MSPLSPDQATLVFYLGLAGLAAAMIFVVVWVRRGKIGAQMKAENDAETPRVPIAISVSEPHSTKLEALENKTQPITGPLKTSFIMEKVESYNRYDADRMRLETEIALKKLELTQVEMNLIDVSSDLREQGIILEHHENSNKEPVTTQPTILAPTLNSSKKTPVVSPPKKNAEQQQQELKQREPKLQAVKKTTVKLDPHALFESRKEKKKNGGTPSESSVTGEADISLLELTAEEKRREWLENQN